ncbi:1-phosphofructokinase family hexose kinase [Candidatus Bipolaricaulota bacterium]|nr:1-phosphofructokinase family hexose kinase [Candidatus Bipolaricaulota bacterium]
MKEVDTLTMNPAIDVSVSASQVLPEEKLRCSRPAFEPGGGGINVSRAMRKLGGSAVPIVLAGGHNGSLLSELLESEKLEPEILGIEDTTRQNLTVLDKSAEVQYRFVMPGPEVTSDELVGVEEKVSNITPRPDFLVLSGSLPESVNPDFYARVIRKAKGRGTRVILDTSGTPLRKALEEGVFLAKPNIGEMVNLAERKLDEEPQQIGFARELVDRGSAEAIVLSLGAGGAFLVTEKGSTHLRSPTVPIISKVGAGDSMVAGITYGLANDYSLKASASLGVAAGAAAVMTPGTELCRKEDTFRLWDQVGAQRQG